MSANNWATCPRCEEKRTAEQRQRAETAAQAYGKVSAEEYEALREEAARTDTLEPTLREDWGIGVGTDGIFEVDYSCYCSHCDFAFRFKQKKVAYKVSE